MIMCVLEAQVHRHIMVNICFLQFFLPPSPPSALSASIYSSLPSFLPSFSLLSYGSLCHCIRYRNTEQLCGLLCFT